MQVYLPFPDFKLSAMVLDERTMAAQGNVTFTILNTLAGKSKGWKWHPGVKMWEGNEDFLAQYALRLYKEWVAVGISDENKKGYPDHWTLKVNGLGYHFSHAIPQQPWWFGNKRYHEGCQSALVRINKSWYKQFFADDGELCEWWPLAEEHKFIHSPQPVPNGQSTYLMNGKPIWPQAMAMQDQVFVDHVNAFHNLTPDVRGDIQVERNEHILIVLRQLHDRFHQQRVYSSHDHS